MVSLTLFIMIKIVIFHCTVLPAKSGSDIVFCLQSYPGLRIDRPQDRINTQVMYDWRLLEQSVQVNVLLNNCRERSGRVLDSRPRGRGFEPHRHHCVVLFVLFNSLRPINNLSVI